LGNDRLPKLTRGYLWCDQWHSEAKCRPGLAIKVPPFPSLKFAYKQLK